MSFVPSPWMLNFKIYFDDCVVFFSLTTRLLFAIPVMLLLVCYSWTRYVPFLGIQTAMHRALEFTGSMVVLSGGNYLIALALKVLLRQRGW